MFSKILDALTRLEGVAHKTPVLTSTTLNQISGAEIFLKCENFQRVGAFKFRGAYNAISQLSNENKEKGVLAYSSGNHAQGIALAGKILGVKTHIIMPSNAPGAKIEATRQYGADVIMYDPENTKREDLARSINEIHNYTIIPPYDHQDIIAGQGTVAVEFHRQVEDLDLLLVPCGGGGLLSGCAVATKNINPACKVMGIEPELADDATRSFKTKILHTVSNPPTIADGARTPYLGKLTFPLILDYVADMQTVSEAEIINAVKFLFYSMKIVVEPTGALAVAAALSKRFDNYKKIGIVITGGNIDGNVMMEILRG